MADFLRAGRGPRSEISSELVPGCHQPVNKRDKLTVFLPTTVAVKRIRIQQPSMERLRLELLAPTLLITEGSLQDLDMQNMLFRGSDSTLCRRSTSNTRPVVSFPLKRLGIKVFVFAALLASSRFAMATDWYVDINATGANTGTSWADAWTNMPGIVGWQVGGTPVPQAGDTVWISGPGSYTNFSIYGLNGTSNAPIRIKASQEAGHNGLVQMTPLAMNGQWFIVDGAKDDNFTNSVNLDNMANLYQITNNINIWIRGPLGFGSNSANGIACPNAGPGMKFKWLHIDPYTFNTNNWPYGNNSSGVGANTHGLNINQQTGETLDNGELGYCYVEHADQCGVNILNNNSAHWNNQFRIHHNVITMMGDAGMRLANGFEVDHNIIGKNWMLHGHPNGIVIGPSFSLVHHNIIYNTMDTMMYTPGGGSPVAYGIKVYNNLFYTTWDWSFVYTNEFSANKPFVNHGTQGAFQFLVEANANKVEPWLPQVWTNFIVVNNTVIHGMGAVATNLSGGIQTCISLPNRYAPGDSLSVDPEPDRGFIYPTNFIVKNNMFYSVAPNGSGQGLGGFPGWVDRFSPDITTWSNPAVTYTSGYLYGPSNVVVDYNLFSANDPAVRRFTYNGPYSTNYFASAEAFNAVYAAIGYTHNSSAIPLLMDINGYDFRPRTNDIAAVANGQNLSDLANTPGGMPGLFMDLAGVTRPAGAWTIGAYEPAGSGVSALAGPSLIARWTFDDLGPGGAGAKSLDVTGGGHDMLFFGFPNTPTNWPTRVAYTNGTAGGYAANFWWDTNSANLNGTGFYYGQFGGITNLGAFTNLTALTVSSWVKYFQPPLVGADGSCTIIDVCYGATGCTWSLGRNYAWQTSFDIFTNLNYNTDHSLHMNFPDNASTDWHLYTATFDCASQVMAIYLDGTNCGTRNFTGYSPALTNLTVCKPYSGGIYPGYQGWMAIGCRTHAGSPSIADGDGFPNNGWMNGQVHDLRVYGRALSPAEIQSLYSGSTVGISRPPAPLGFRVVPVPGI